MPPEGSSEDDSDEQGGMPEDAEEDDDCAGPADMFRPRTEKLPGDK